MRAPLAEPEPVPAWAKIAKDGVVPNNDTTAVKHAAIGAQNTFALICVPQTLLRIEQDNA
jgi:hypothetical protein